MRFKDRRCAGRQLAAALQSFKGRKDAIVLALPRGGLVIGFEIVTALHLPLSVIVSKKIPAPGNEELAIGAVSLNRTVFLDETIISNLQVPLSYINLQKNKLGKKVMEKFKSYTGFTRPPSLKGKLVIISDDGVATGSTMIAAIQYARIQQAGQVVIAVPVAPLEARPMLEKIADKVVCLSYEPLFGSVGQFYEEFSQVEDAEAKAYLLNANKHQKMI